MANITSMTPEEAQACINAIDERNRRINSAVDKACKATHANAGINAGRMNNSAQAQAYNLRSIADRMIARGEELKAGLRKAMGFLSDADDQGSMAVNAVDHSAASGALPNMARLG